MMNAIFAAMSFIAIAEFICIVYLLHRLDAAEQIGWVFGRLLEKAHDEFVKLGKENTQLVKEIHCALTADIIHVIDENDWED